MLMIESILITITCVSFFLFVKSKPESEPSLAALKTPRNRNFLAAF